MSSEGTISERLEVHSRAGLATLGLFLKKYASSPEPSELGARSSIREDVVVREITRTLGQIPGTIRVLDACCGLGATAAAVVRSPLVDKNRIEYVAVDRDTGCVRKLETGTEQFTGFAQFQIVQRDICDLPDIQSGSIHLIILNNSLHEIAPHLYPAMFATFNRLILPMIGRICVVDMEELPRDSPEATAITWKADQVKDFLRAGGLTSEVSVHPKGTSVYQAHVHPAASVDQAGITKALVKILRRKLDDDVASRRSIEVRLGHTADEYKRWLVLTGSIARYADELIVLGGRTTR